MQILFICGSLEPGQDGVGDYIRRLCSEIIRQGHKGVIAAINDTYVTNLHEFTDVVDGVSIEILRIPATWPAKKQLEKMAQWAQSFNPDRISLQYVPYSFNKFGVPFRMGYRLKQLRLKVGWQIMVHEPFLGYSEKGIKNKLVRALQIKSLQVLKKCLKPVVFHTTIPYYQKMLESISVKAKLLGLFGNISVVGTEANLKSKKEAGTLVGVYFGAVPPLSQHSEFARKIDEFCNALDKKLSLVFCGRSGSLKESFVSAITNSTNETSCKISVVGQLEAEEISILFDKADFGISRVPPRLIGKSGAAICMLEHGLPLWIPLWEGENDADYLDFRPDLCFTTPKDLKLPQKGAPLERLPLIAKQLVADFKSI